MYVMGPGMSQREAVVVGSSFGFVWNWLTDKIFLPGFLFLLGCDITALSCRDIIILCGDNYVRSDFCIQLFVIFYMKTVLPH